MKNHEKDFAAVYVFLFCIFLGVVFCFCYSWERSQQQAQSDAAVIAGLRLELADCRTINQQLNDEITECRIRSERIERQLQSTTDQLRISNERLDAVAGVISESVGTATEARNGIERCREIIRQLSGQLEEIREIIESEELPDYIPDSQYHSGTDFVVP